ncbi:hypothetical protein ABK040_011532 [Willaertia magna]
MDPKLTPTSKSRWSTNNPCSELAQQGLICEEKIKQDLQLEIISIEKAEEIFQKKCNFYFMEYKNCMNSEMFEKKKFKERLISSRENIHTSGFSMFTWK